MTPEQLARQNIDQMLSGSGWDVQNSADMNITASLGVAVREFPLKTGSADYGLYINGKVAGVIEAKKEVPKTLIFAKTDLHADDIVKIVREEFGRGNEFCQKITSKSQVSGKALAAGKTTKIKNDATGILYSRPHRARCNACSKGLPIRQSPLYHESLPRKSSEFQNLYSGRAITIVHQMLHLTTSA